MLSRSRSAHLRITTDMIKMFEEDKVIIAPDLKVKDLQAKNMELDEIIEYAITKGYATEDILFTADAFSSDFVEMLHHDREILEQLNADWRKKMTTQNSISSKKTLLITSSIKREIHRANWYCSPKV